MSDCCHPAYAAVFNEKYARGDAKRYRKRGLDPQSRQIVAFLTDRPLEGSSVLEVGGGIGAIQLELLKAGAEHATSVELSPQYEAVAAELLAEANLSDRADRRIGDFTEMNGDLPVADAVVMNKVVCCYPDMPALVNAAAAHARNRIVLVMPREFWFYRLGIRLANLYLRLRRNAFRGFIHSRQALLDIAAARGFTLADEHAGRLWDVILLERTAAPPA
jgi:2-polyprenyl-3-methyl-5-hydroxy-6-metoxy-1,4-benzoquinol methylase